jgi:hypothetical protein
MAWEIKIWHETVGDRTRLSIEASTQVPDDVISHLSSVYWSEEIQGYEEEWEEAGPFESAPGGRFQG